MKLNAFACLMIILSGLVTAALHKAFDIPLPIILGIFSGAVTNTPSLGAGQQVLSDLSAPAELVNQMGMAYAMAYPFGICGILLAMWTIRLLFRVNIDKEAKAFDRLSGAEADNLQTMNIQVCNTNLVGLQLQDIPIVKEEGVVCSRLKRGNLLMVPSSTTLVELGDLLHLVGDRQLLNQAKLLIGTEVDVALSTRTRDLKMARVVVTSEKVMGKKIAELNLHRHDVVITRLNRAGVELVANRSLSLHFGDILNLVGKPEAIDTVADLVGNAQQRLQQVQMLPVFIGIALGVLLGSIPLYIPGFPAALRLGLAGGPLVVALILGRIGTLGKMHWFMPPSANPAAGVGYRVVSIRCRL